MIHWKMTAIKKSSNAKIYAIQPLLENNKVRKYF